MVAASEARAVGCWSREPTSTGIGQSTTSIRWPTSSTPRCGSSSRSSEPPGPSIRSSAHRLRNGYGASDSKRSRVDDTGMVIHGGGPMAVMFDISWQRFDPVLKDSRRPERQRDRRPTRGPPRRVVRIQLWRYCRVGVPSQLTQRLERHLISRRRRPDASSTAGTVVVEGVLPERRLRKSRWQTLATWCRLAASGVFAPRRSAARAEAGPTTHRRVDRIGRPPIRTSTWAANAAAARADRSFLLPGSAPTRSSCFPAPFGVGCSVTAGGPDRRDAGTGRVRHAQAWVTSSSLSSAGMVANAKWPTASSWQAHPLRCACSANGANRAGWPGIGQTM